MKRAMAWVAVAAVVAGCAISSDPAPTVTVPLPTPTTVAPTTTEPIPVSYRPAPEFRGLGLDDMPTDTSLVAMATGEIDVYEQPGAETPIATLPATTILGTTTVTTILEGPDEGGWARVMLPGRPNGSTGWIETEDARLYVVEGRILIDLSDRTITLFRDGQEVLTSPVAVGSDRNPTPEGHFYVTDSVRLSDASSPWGPYALGLSGRSDTITEYNGGDGIIGIHGTNRPDSIGRAASLGCVRLPNDVIARLHELVSIGTPVEIRA